VTTDEKLLGVHPVLALKVRRILDAMRALGFEMIVTDGVRTTQEQQALWRRGRTEPGKKVTNADGVTTISKHQTRRAVDCCFLVNGVASWAESNPWALYGAMARAIGLTWGGDFTSIKDRPHVELGTEDA
jgi:peptidoglycan L-alanyl-D-glutamate endopeptidase CwlK